eukprot:604969-Hanusia_phi.AAC.1
MLNTGVNGGFEEVRVTISGVVSIFGRVQPAKQGYRSIETSSWWMWWWVSEQGGGGTIAQKEFYEHGHPSKQRGGWVLLRSMEWWMLRKISTGGWRTGHTPGVLTPTPKLSYVWRGEMLSQALSRRYSWGGWVVPCKADTRGLSWGDTLETWGWGGLGAG